VGESVRQLLCYGDSNTWGCIPLVGDESPGRLASDERWPGVLRRELGSGYWIVENGLNGRTTVWDDGLGPYRNGRDLLMPTLLAHYPLDLVIVMLGTNDLKRRFNVSAKEIAEGAGQLLDVVAASGCGPDFGAPQALLVCPPSLARLERFADEFEGGTEKSRELSGHFRAVAEARTCWFLDAGAHVSSSDSDGIHLDREAHASLGSAVANAVRAILPSGGRSDQPRP
jgi:lysophospholipase L1-like esterase